MSDGATASSGRLGVLHVILMLGETNSQYNEHCLPLVGVRDLSICTYFAPRLTPPGQIAMFPGDGTIRGFFRALRSALDSRRYDAIHVHAPESAAMVVAALTLRGRILGLRPRLVYTVHDSFLDYGPRNRALMLATWWAFRSIVFCGGSARDSYPRPWRWMAGRRARVVRNGADIDRVDRVLRAANAGRVDDRFTVLSVGRLERVKDPMTAVRAFAKGAGPDARMVVVGAGPLEAEMRAEAAREGAAERVELTGLIERESVFGRFAEADVLVSASRGEGLPVAVIEAMAAGCPVILSDIPPHRELAEGADLLPLVPVGDAEGFAGAIARLAEMTGAERAELGRRGREHVVARFGLAQMQAGYDAVYADLGGRVIVPAGAAR